MNIVQNKELWNQSYQWELQQGDEWSSQWGGVAMQWDFTIYPRIRSFVPTETILEIAPGFGRWTQFLAPLCKDLIVIDLSEKCIEACKKRFHAYSHITYCVNDGKSLDMIPDESIDFVFSFDSLVHADSGVIEAYLEQLARKLKKDGAGFIHHSNAGRYRTYFSLMNKIPECSVKYWLVRFKLIDPWWHWHDYSMTAEKFKLFAEKAGFQCVNQEVINWVATKKLIGCFSTFQREGSGKTLASKTIENRDFRREIRHVRKLSELYGKRERRDTRNENGIFFRYRS